MVERDGLHERGRRPTGSASGEEEGLVLVAEHQTAGRGRLGREWVTAGPAPRWRSRSCSCPMAPGGAVAVAAAADRGRGRGRRTARHGCRGRAEVAQRRAGRRPQARRDPARAGGARTARPPRSWASGSTATRAREELPVPEATSLALVDRGPGRPLGAAGGAGRGARCGATTSGRRGGDVRAGVPRAVHARPGSRCAWPSRRRGDRRGGGRRRGRSAGGRTADGEERLGAGDVVHVRPEALTGPESVA